MRIRIKNAAPAVVIVLAVAATAGCVVVSDQPSSSASSLSPSHQQGAAIAVLARQDDPALFADHTVIESRYACMGMAAVVDSPEMDVEEFIRGCLEGLRAG